MTFTAITQGWLRETAKRWVLEELPRRRGRRVGGTVQAYVNSIARLPESLRAHPDDGRIPAALERADIENFLSRLAFQQSAGQISLHQRERICRDLRQIFEHVRALGLTRPGQAAAGLGDDFALLADDVPHPPEPGEPCRDLPAEIIGQLCGHLDELEAISSWRMWVAVELLIDTGRRPRRSAPSGSTAWTGTATGCRCWSTATTRRPGWADACRSARLPPRLVADQQARNSPPSAPPTANSCSTACIGVSTGRTSSGWRAAASARIRRTAEQAGMSRRPGRASRSASAQGFVTIRLPRSSLV